MTVKIVVLAEANGPEDLAATIAESGDGFDVSLTWAAPTGGGAVTGYRVEYQPDPALQWRTLAASQSGTTYADSGLGRGTVRYYRVAALRSGGASYSDIVRVQAPSETTEVPEQVNYVEVEPAAGLDTALEVAWNRPRTPLSRAPATGYHVQYAQHDGAAPAWRDGEDWAEVTFPRWMERLPWRTWSGAVEEIEFEESTERSPSLKTVVTGLESGTNYRVRVRGCTEAGCGEWSYPRRWTTSGATSNATEAEPLTATLEDFPVNHDGSGAFTFRIAFSAEVTVSRQDMQEHALTVIGGTVTNARRVDGRKDLWELTVEPAGTGAVSILVPLDRACTETGALCTADGQALSTGLGHNVPGPALTPLAAAFVSVPAEHDGETEFWLELSFDAAVEQGSKQAHPGAARGERGFGDEAAPQGRAAGPLAGPGRTVLARGGHGDAVAVAALRGDGGGVHGGRAHVHDRARDANPGPAGPGGRGCAGAGSGERDARLRGDAQPGAFGHGDGGLCDLGRHGHGRVGLHGDERDAHLRRGRDGEDGLGAGARRRP